jgi:hypothetical protein
MAEGGTASRFRPIENDDLDPNALKAFLTVCFSNAAAVLRPGGSCARPAAPFVERYFAPGKAALLSVGEQIDTRSAAGRLVLNVLASVRVPAGLRPGHTAAVRRPRAGVLALPR